MRFLLNSLSQDVVGRRSAAALTAIAVAYPFLVYEWHEQVSFVVFALGASILLLLRACIASGGIVILFRLPLLLAAISLLVLSVVDAALAAKVYPALISLIVAVLFGHSLRYPPSLVEKIARLRDPELSAVGQSYCRRLTWIWTIWLVINAGIAGGLAAQHNIYIWTLWTGVVSYIGSGALFLGEIVLRPWLMKNIRESSRDA